MLVITRRINESIIIDTGKDKIEIILKDIRGKGARIGIIADKRVSVLREELNRNREKECERGKFIRDCDCDIDLD